MVLGGEAFPHPLVFFFLGGGGQIDNSKQTDNTDIFQSSSLHKFSDSTVRILHYIQTKHINIYSEQCKKTHLFGKTKGY